MLFAAVHESASGPKQTCRKTQLCRYWGKADMTFCGANVCF